MGRYPWLLTDGVTISQAAGAEVTLQGLLVAVGLAVILVLPPLAYLSWLTPSEEWADHGGGGSGRRAWPAGGWARRPEDQRPA